MLTHILVKRVKRTILRFRRLSACFIRTLEPDHRHPFPNHETTIAFICRSSDVRHVRHGRGCHEKGVLSRQRRHIRDVFTELPAMPGGTK